MSEANVTWLLPVKNGMPYLPETLASIEAQTYPHWEIIAWDNGSTDGSIEELHRWIPSRLPGRIIADTPLGLGASLAKMTEMSQTEYCARIDADDVNFPDRLEKQVQFLDNNPRISLVGSQVIRVDKSGNSLNVQDVVPENHEDIVNTLLTRCCIYHPTVLFRKKSVIDSGNYRNITVLEGKFEDYDLWLRFIRSYKVANLNYACLKYRVHANSVTQIGLNEKQLSFVVKFLFTLNALGTFGCSEEDAALLCDRCHPNSTRIFTEIANYLYETQGDFLPKERLGSVSFQESCRELIPISDRTTLIRLCIYSGNVKGILNIAKYHAKKEYYRMRIWVGGRGIIKFLKSVMNNFRCQ